MLIAWEGVGVSESSTDDPRIALALLRETVAHAAVAASAAPASQELGVWLEALEASQHLLNVLAGIQDALIARVACFEVDFDEATGETIHVAQHLGYCSLDAPDLVATSTHTTRRYASGRVDAALDLAADGVSDTACHTGLRAIHEAALQGQVDPYRAWILMNELHDAEPSLREGIIAALGERLGAGTGPQLRQAVRRVIVEVAPELLQARADRAREECGLTRHVSEPGVDKWVGLFPAEDALPAWAAVDALARDYRDQGRCPTLERARGKALTDLVTGAARVTTSMVIAVPHGGVPDADEGCEDAVQREPQTTPWRAGSAVTGQGAECRRMAQSGPPIEGGVGAPRGHSAEAHPAITTVELVEVTSSATGVDRMWVPRASLRSTFDGRNTTRLCHPVSGALLDRGGTFTRERYRPPAALVELVKARDGRCRFPGCSVSVRYCDLDHVRPWPIGPTAAENLLCLCRRHHRIKTMNRWRVVLDAETAVATWFDPVGRLHLTEPVDHLSLSRIRVNRVHSAPAGTAWDGDLEFSVLEFGMEHLAASSSRICECEDQGCPPCLETHVANATDRCVPRRRRGHGPPDWWWRRTAQARSGLTPRGCGPATFPGIEVHICLSEEMSSLLLRDEKEHDWLREDDLWEFTDPVGWQPPRPGDFQGYPCGPDVEHWHHDRQRSRPNGEPSRLDCRRSDPSGEPSELDRQRSDPSSEPWKLDPQRPHVNSGPSQLDRQRSDPNSGPSQLEPQRPHVNCGPTQPDRQRSDPSGEPSELDCQRADRSGEPSELDPQRPHANREHPQPDSEYL